MIPNWWQFLLLGLAAFRLTRLGGWDDLTIPFRRYITGMGDEEHHQWAHVIEKLQGHGTNLWEEPFEKLSVLEAHWVTLTGEGALPRLVSDAAVWAPAVRYKDAGLVQGYYAAPTPPVPHWRFYLSKLVHCPWCLGAWLSLLIWVAWLAWPHFLVLLSVPLALSAVVGLVAKNLDS